MAENFMKELERLDDMKCYVFSWELDGYDCTKPEIRSPIFTVNFLVTDWYMKLDLSQLQNIKSFIPFRLQRVSGIGPHAVTLDVKITVKLGENKDFSREKSQIAKVFSESSENFWEFDIDIPIQNLDSKELKEFGWLTARKLMIDVEMKSSKKTDPAFPKIYWKSKASLIQVLKDLQKLHEVGHYHDLVWKFSGEELKLHKCILNVRWPKLMSILNISESSKEVETEEFEGTSSDLLKALLRFAYMGDVEFTYKLDKIEGGIDVFDVVRKHNFYRLCDKITRLPQKCSSSQFFQSYRTTIEMKFTNVTDTEMPMSDFRTCNIPLEPQKLPEADGPQNEKERLKFQQHIRFLDLTLYVNKGPLGYNWLMFSIVLGKIPLENSVIVKCKLYVVGESDINYLLTEQILVFDGTCESKFTTPFAKNKTCKRYPKISEPVITWRELTDESRKFMRKGLVTCSTSQQSVREKDLRFRFELKLSDGEECCDTRHGESEWNSTNGDPVIYRDLELMYNDEKFTDITVTSGGRSIKAHKAILAARSKTLDALLRKSSNSESLSINIQPDNLHLFVHYIYTGQLHDIPTKRLSNILSAAEEYKMDCLKDIVTQRLVESKVVHIV